jgi:hypothetical protein
MQNHRQRALAKEAMGKIKKVHKIELTNRYDSQKTELTSLRIPRNVMTAARIRMKLKDISFTQLVVTALKKELKVK